MAMGDLARIDTVAVSEKQVRGVVHPVVRMFARG